MIVGTVVVVQKFFSDTVYFNSSISDKLQLPIQHLNEVELEILKTLDFHINVTSSQYRHQLNVIKTFWRGRGSEALRDYRLFES